MKRSRGAQYLVGMLLLSGALLFCFENCSPSKFKSSSIQMSSQSFAAVTSSTPPIPSPVPEDLPVASLAMDQSTPNCTDANLIGWKCLVTTIRTIEGLDYTVALRWNRPGQTARGTMIMAVGGAGTGESRDDPPSKQMMDDLDQLDQMRTIEINFIDVPNVVAGWGGYFKYAGAYYSAGSAFTSVIKFIFEKQLIRGSFVNYLGGSNASVVAAYAMSHFGVDQYFDRVVFQMGPFLPNLQSACDPNSASSFSLNSYDQQVQVAHLINAWTFGDQDKSVCANASPDRISVLKNGNSYYPKTHLHTIIGADEPTRGFGPWIVASNLEWFNSVTGKSKSRIVRAGMAHNNSYVDMRRYLKLAPNETVDPTEFTIGPN